jgi:glycerol-3-phosphate dehydrogenase
MPERERPPTLPAEADLVVVGGGIHGAMVHLRASRAGLRSVLVEMRDFGQGASWNTSRVLHGGIRYLQRGDLRRVRRSVLSRRWFLRAFPEFTSVLPCLMPLHGVGLRRPTVLGMALKAHDLLSRDRNQGLPDSHWSPASRLLSRVETDRETSGIVAGNPMGGALWFDGLVSNPSRVLMEILNWAQDLGGHAFNYLHAREIRTRGGEVTRVVVEDALTREEREIATTRVVDCTGAFSSPDLPESGGGASTPGLNFSFNLLLNRSLPSSSALAVSAGGGRGQLLFLVPVGELTIAGTVHEPVRGKAPTGPSTEARDRMLGDLDAALPGWGVTGEHVLQSLSGLIPEKAESDRIVDHGRGGLLRGLLEVRSAKYTTAPTTSLKVLYLLLKGKGEGLEGSPRPPVTRAVTPAELVRMHRSDPGEARAWVQTIRTREKVFSPEDFALRRMDWAFHPEAREEAEEIVRAIFQE